MSGRGGRHADCEGLSLHILPNAGTMVGVCTTLIGLVKIYETQAGQTHVDEYAALTAILFLASAAASYLALRLSADSGLALRLERTADICFLIGLGGLCVIAVMFAYEAI